VEKKTLITAIIISALLFSAVAGTNFVKEGNSNPIPYPKVEITIENPQSITYNVSTFPLIFSVKQTNFDSELSFYYSLNGQELKPVGNVTTVKEESYPMYPFIAVITLRGSCVLFNLSEGRYSLIVYAFEQSLKDGGSEVAHSADFNFQIDLAPSISILNLESKTYNTSRIVLNFTVNEPVSQITYSLDGQKNVTINGNTTLTGLPNGDHNVAVYATDMAGHIGASETIYFIVEEPLPTSMVIAPFASLAVAGVSLLVYFKKRKR
jgi:hypothetical protein